ncbi:MAG: LicD family protein [Oscillospiraceae bacterium]|nr:LicD family protein [Oscillospiraceae bacterium]
MDKNISPFKEKLLRILQCFHQFCVYNGLTYYIGGGTALGAARHKGFIPWDDDIDIAMPREDYERFLTLTAGKLSHIYAVETSGPHNADFKYAYAKIYDTTTTLIESAQEPIVRGLYIDVFPLDGVGYTYNDSVIYIKKILNMQNLLFAKICSLSKNRKWYKNLAILLFQLFPFVNEKKLIAKIEAACKERAYGAYPYVANIVGNWGIKEIMRKDIFGTPTLYPFEDLFVYGPEKLDEFLTALYGNYRTLPPIEKQKSHHKFLLCDLNNSYLKKD